jgi:ATP-dependent DNA ligase
MVVDGEVVALDAKGKPSFNTLQNYGTSHGPILYYVFDLLILAGRNVMAETLERRRALLEAKILPRLATRYAFPRSLRRALPISYSRPRGQAPRQQI